MLDVIENPDVVQALQQDKNQNLQYLKDNYDVSFVCDFSPILTGFFFHLAAYPGTNHCFGHFQYTYGNYSDAADYLYHFRVLSTDNTSAHWGKLASDILTGKWTRRAQHAVRCD